MHWRLALLSRLFSGILAPRLDAFEAVCKSAHISVEFGRVFDLLLLVVPLQCGPVAADVIRGVEDELVVHGIHTLGKDALAFHILTLVLNVLDERLHDLDGDVGQVDDVAFAKQMGMKSSKKLGEVLDEVRVPTLRALIFVAIHGLLERVRGRAALLVRHAGNFGRREQAVVPLLCKIQKI